MLILPKDPWEKEKNSADLGLHRDPSSMANVLDAPLGAYIRKALGLKVWAPAWEMLEPQEGRI